MTRPNYLLSRPIGILTDCIDANARYRLRGRFAALTGMVPGIDELPRDNPAYFAGLTLADTLQAGTVALGQHQVGTILVVNAAPRNGDHPNGPPFGYFWYQPDPDCTGCQPHLVVTTVADEILSPLRHRLGITEIRVVDVEQVMKEAMTAPWSYGLTDTDVDMVANTQFRSLWFQTLLAVWLDREHQFDSDIYPIPRMGPELVVHVVDNFGNCKFEVTPEELGMAIGHKYQVKAWGRTVPVDYCERLVNVGHKQPGLVRGSGGCLELVIRMGDAADKFDLSVGQAIEVKPA
jgi:hypothetical protein